ncbi:MAG: hypothetical protein WEB88_07080 [Gemmatimonadota bacterium]
MIRGRLRPALCALCALPFLQSALIAQEPAFEEGILEFAAERLPPITVLILVDSSGAVLVPVVQLARHLGLEVVREGSSIRLPSISGGSAVLDAAVPLMTLDGDTVQLAPAEVAAREDEVYLRVERLELLLEAQATLDLSRLTLALTRDVPFPRQQAILAEQRRAVLLARQRMSERREQLDSVPYRSASGVGVLDWDLATSGLDPARLTTLRARAGAALLGGDLSTGFTLAAGRDAREAFGDVALRYHRVFPTARYIEQASAGQIVTSGIFSRFVNGFEISNRPFLRGPELGEMLLQPDLPAGWEYEVFQGNVLLGYSAAGAQDAVAVPLRTGATPVQVRMYGPAGQEVVTTLLYQTPTSMLPAGSLEYATGAGRCVGALCDRYAHADVRYGATAFLTIGGGAEHVADAVADHLRPYVLGSISTGQRAVGELTLMPGALYSGAVAVFPRAGSRAQLRGSVSRPGFGPVSILPDSTRRWDTELTWHERLEAEGQPFTQLRVGAAAAGAASGLERWRLNAAVSFRRGYLEARFDREPSALSPSLLTSRLSLMVPVDVLGRTYRPMLSHALGLGRHGIRLAELGLSMQTAPNAVINAAMQWSRGQQRPALSLTFSARRGSFGTTLRAVSSPRGGGSSAAVFNGSVSLAPDTSFTFQPTARTGYAGVHGVVFVDVDGDGAFSAGDTPVPAADLLVDGRRVVADEHGRYRSWALQPYRVAAVAVDSTRSADPSLTTTAPALYVRPVPNTAQRVDVPLVRTRELAGSVTAGEGVPTVAGLTLEITSVDGAHPPMSTVTFSDGQFYVSRILPGRYRIAVARSSLDALGAEGSPASLEFTVPAAGNDLLVDVPPLHLVPRRDAGRAEGGPHVAGRASPTDV